MKTEEETADEMIAEFHAELYFDVGAKTQAINCAIVSCDRVIKSLEENYDIEDISIYYTKVKTILQEKL